MIVTRSTRVLTPAEKLAFWAYRRALIHGPQFNTTFPAGRLPRPAQPAPAG